MIRAAIAALALAAPVHAQDIEGASFAEPTDAYPHAVLGDALEWRTLDITLRNPATPGALHTHRISASEDSVFEDLAPRLWDVTGDRAPEVVVVESSQRLGARLLIFGVLEGELRQIAATPHIGKRFRWLAPVGAADFDGDGHIEVAYVDRPHLAKTLRVWRYEAGGIRQIASLDGVSNHRIGEDFISGGVRDCGDGPEMVMADAGWRSVISVRLSSTGLSATHIAEYSRTADFDRALACR